MGYNKSKKMDTELKDSPEEFLVTFSRMLGSFKPWGGVDTGRISAGTATCREADVQVLQVSTTGV